MHTRERERGRGFGTVHCVFVSEEDVGEEEGVAEEVERWGKRDVDGR